MNLVCDKELGFWAIVEVAVSGILDMWLKYPCDTGNHRPEHSDGHPWWAGQEGTDINLISLNKFPAIKGTTTYDNLSSVRSALGTIFDLGGDSGSANLLGRLIDYDKNNIQQMNKALARINYEMTRSMRETAENVLKASLADNRLETQTSLADYWVSIQIPYARNPYPDDEIVTNRRVVVNSYFSPLRNTEPDENFFSVTLPRPLAWTNGLCEAKVFTIKRTGNGRAQFPLALCEVKGSLACSACTRIRN